MSNSVARSVKVVGAAVVAVLASVGIDAATYAATGDSLVLGRTNEADMPTTVRNTGTGPTLRLVSSDPATPNLYVSSRAKINKLNADLLDGVSSSAFMHGTGEVLSGTVDAHWPPAACTGC